MKAVIRYPGSKWRIADWIISFFPAHKSYVEPFFGSGGVLFNKTRSSIETVNDIDGDVINFFEQVQKDPERLAEKLYYIPYARQIYEQCFEPTDNDLQKAVNFCIRCQMGYGVRLNGKTGWKRDVQGREKAYAAKDWTEMPQKIISTAERLRGVQIECRPALEIIESFNSRDVLIYADPPYMLSTRTAKQYKHEMTAKDHYQLLDRLKVSKSLVLISGYSNPLYRDMLRDWHREEKVSMTQSGKMRKETLWMNFEPPKQRTIFDYLEDEEQC